MAFFGHSKTALLEKNRKNPQNKTKKKNPQKMKKNTGLVRPTQYLYMSWYTSSDHFSVNLNKCTATMTFFPSLFSTGKQRYRLVAFKAVGHVSQVIVSHVSGGRVSYSDNFITLWARLLACGRNSEKHWVESFLPTICRFMNANAASLFQWWPTHSSKSTWNETGCKQADLTRMWIIY